MITGIDEIWFEEASEANAVLAKDIITHLEADRKASGFSTLFLPGGTSPIGLFDALKAIPFDWTNIQICPIDERIAEPREKWSNAMLLERELVGRNISPRHIFTPDITDPNLTKWEAFCQKNANPCPFVVVGMGPDGHVASIFPNDVKGRQISEHLTHTMAPQHPQARVSLTLECLSKSKNLALLIKGSQKQNAFKDYRKDPNSPVARLLAKAKGSVAIYQFN